MAALLDRERLRRRVVDVVRSGPRTVVLTASPGPRFGNVLYFWLHAHRQSRQGRPWVVQVPPEVRPWVGVLPGLVSLSVDAPRMRDRRVWPPERLWQRFGVDFSRGDVDAFVRERLLPAPLLAAAPARPAGEVVVNVRRGDYYSVAKHRGNYGFDIVSYVSEGLDRCRARGPVTSVHVVSDDPSWCREHLAPLAAERGLAVSFADPGRPHEHFATLCAARTLIGANSTFSYWAGHVISAREGHGGHVVMPGFHGRHVNGGHADQLDPSWDVVADLPHGWAEPAP